jgi:hypothetical protein
MGDAAAHLTGADDAYAVNVDHDCPLTSGPSWQIESRAVFYHQISPPGSTAKLCRQILCSTVKCHAHDLIRKVCNFSGSCR